MQKMTAHVKHLNSISLCTDLPPFACIAETSMVE